jgi:hypothetical protein
MTFPALSGVGGMSFSGYRSGLEGAPKHVRSLQVFKWITIGKCLNMPAKGAQFFSFSSTFRQL